MSDKVHRQYLSIEINKRMTKMMIIRAVKTAESMSTKEFFTDTLLVD